MRFTKNLAVLALFLFAGNALAAPTFNRNSNPETDPFLRSLGIRTICGKTDDRTPSSEAPVGRARNIKSGAGCTATMIGRACAISAGHCVGGMELVEFNTPASVAGAPIASKPEDQYLIDLNTLNYLDKGQGRDFAVFMLRPNIQTNRYAGDVQGWFTIAKTLPALGEEVRITGYGRDDEDPTRNLAQQTHLSEVEFIQETILYHHVDTMGGNSGASIRLEKTGEILAIHTNGGCYTESGANRGTALPNNPEALKAIAACLESEKNLK